MTHDAQSLRDRFEAAGQGQVFAYFDELEPAQRDALCAQAAMIDLAEIAELNETLVKTGGVDLDLSGLKPAPYIPHPDHGGDAAKWAAARAAGEEALRAGRVAAFVVAGGQGTRLGYDGPKGTFPVSPVRRASLFQIFAEKLRAASYRYGKPIPWFVMTSVVNHEATVAAFEANGYFGLNKSDVYFFQQGLMPAVDGEGRILLEDRHLIAMSPDGHGGSLRALARSGSLAVMAERGIDTISYFQVDNPLVKVIDPAFIGFHLLEGSEMSSKMLPKAYPKEKVGVFCQQGGTTCVVEYSDLPDALAEQTADDGELAFKAGSIAIHILDRAFAERLGGDRADVKLPFHRADKKIAVYDPAAGKPVKPEAPNGIKFEMFVFDALPFAKNPVVIETKRENDFSPVKNAEGLDSPQTSRDDQLREFARWAKAAGVPLQTDDTGLPSVTFEVTPLFADNEEAFVTKWAALEPKPEIAEGTVL